MKALVTGCAGFIGSHLTDRLLKEGYDVTGIDCFTDYYPRSIKESNIRDCRKNSHFTFIEKDILEIDSFPAVDYIFHEAAQAGVRASWGSSFAIYTRNNIDATQKLLEYYKNTPLKKFVYASSSSVYGDAPLPMREDMKPQPISPYGVSKLAAEHLCYLYWKNFQIPTVSLRYFTVYGPRQRPDMGINKFVHSVINSDSIAIFGDGTQTRDFTYIDDVVKANMLAASSEIKGEYFNIGGGNRISVINLIQTIGDISGNSPKIHYLDKQKGDVDNTWADTKKARDFLHWNADVDIKDGLRKYIQWVKGSF
ncbi:MAG: NAD-dependent epimerase/dehydratase family protein [Methanoregula sp.]